MVVAVAADTEAEDTLRVVAVADGDDVIFVDVGVNVDAVCGVDGIWRLRPLRGRPDEGPAGGRAGLAKLEVVVVVVEERVAVVGGMSPPTKVEYERGLFRRTDEEPAAATSCRPPPPRTFPCQARGFVRDSSCYACSTYVAGVMPGFDFEFLMPIPQPHAAPIAPDFAGLYPGQQVDQHALLQASGGGYAAGYGVGHSGDVAGGGGLTPRTETLLSVSAVETAAMEQLRGCFPTLPPSELRAVLERVGWDVNAAAGELIDIGL